MNRAHSRHYQVARGSVPPTRARWRLLALVTAASLSACAVLPDSGPSLREVQAAEKSGIRVVNVDNSVALRLQHQRSEKLFTDSFVGAEPDAEVVRPGDVLEVSVWEAPPTVLFSPGNGASPLSSSAADMSPYATTASFGTTSNVTTLPQQMVDSEGTIYVPFAGAVHVSGKHFREIEAEITAQLRGKAHKPQVLVRRATNNTAYVTVVGEVQNSTRMPLTPRGEHLLDALAAAGGTKQPVDKITLQLTRNSAVQSLPLDTVIRNPAQNIRLQPGDVVTALYQPLSFTALGATGKNDEINFEAKGISLAQALARAGALLDNRANAEGVFIFRFEVEQSAAPDMQGVTSVIEPSATQSGPVPVIYRVDLKDPRAFFLMQNFPIENKDVLYVANASGAQLQKFLNLLVSTVYPIQGAISLTK